VQTIGGSGLRWRPVQDERPPQDLCADFRLAKIHDSNHMNIQAKFFDLENARYCCKASAGAYAAADISEIATDTHLTIQQLPDSTVIAFRGTHSIRNLLTDADFERRLLMSAGGLNARVHRGFEAALNSVLIAICDALGGCSNAIHAKPIFVTGHSLGGALAVLAAMELHRNGFTIAQVYTFGQPRVGNKAFADWYDSALKDRTWRMVFEEDIVPRFPHLPSFRDPYWHGGNEVFISSLHPTKSIDDLWFNPPMIRMLASDAWGIWRKWTTSHFTAALDPIVDHHIGNYINALDGITNPVPIL